jgi:general secretion pathway protein N
MSAPRAILATALWCALAGAALAQQPAAEPAKKAPAQAAPSPVEVPTLPPLDELEATRERPLFARTRRPPAAVPKPVEQEPVVETVSSEEAPAELIGIVIGPERTFAILRDNSTKEVQHLQKGEKIDDWRLDEIASRRIVLRRGASKINLELFDQKDTDGSKSGAAEQPATPVARRPPGRRPAAAMPRFAQPQQRARPRAPPRRPQRPRHREREEEED